MSPVLDDPQDELAVRVSDAPREKSSCAHLAFGFARPFLHYRPPPLVALPTPCPPRITEPGLEGGAAFRNLRSGSIHTAPNPAVKARASFCSWGQQVHMQWWHRARLTVHKRAPGRCPLCFTAPCPHLLNRVDFL